MNDSILNRSQSNQSRKNALSKTNDRLHIKKKSQTNLKKEQFLHHARLSEALTKQISKTDTSEIAKQEQKMQSQQQRKPYPQLKQESSSNLNQRSGRRFNK